MNFISTIQSGDQREQFGIDSEPLLANTQSETTTALIKERTSDLLYQYDRVISSIEESCTEMTTSNAKRLAASDVERLQWTIHLSDCALEMRKSLERAEILVVQIDKKFQNCENDSSASVTYPGNTSKFGSSLPVEKDKTITRDRHRRAFWEQLIRHHSAVKLAQRIGESSSFKLDDYLEYGPKRKTRRPVKQYNEYPLPPIICEYKSAPKYSFNQNDDPNEGVDGRLLVDIEANTAPWTFAQLDKILEGTVF